MTAVDETQTKVTPRLKERYRSEIKGQLQEQFSYENVMLIPGLVKVVVDKEIR